MIFTTVKDEIAREVEKIELGDHTKRLLREIKEGKI